MVTTAEQMRTYAWSGDLSYGFRPFFLFGAIWGSDSGRGLAPDARRITRLADGLRAD